MTILKNKTIIGAIAFGTALILSSCASVPASTVNTEQADVSAKTSMSAEDMSAMKAECTAMHAKMKAKMAAKMASGEMGMHKDGMMTPEKKAAMKAKHEKHMKCMEMMPEKKMEMKEHCMHKHEDGKMGQCKMMSSDTK